MSLLDDELILEESTDINNHGKILQPDEYKVDNDYNNKKEYYFWNNNLYVEHVLPTKLQHIIINEGLQNQLFKGIKISYGPSNDYYMSTVYHYNFIKIDIVINQDKNLLENNNINIFDFQFWFPFINIESIRPYAYALYESIFYNPEKLNILYNIKQVTYNDIDCQNLNKFYYEFVI